ncbi:MAG: hypothetical protein WAW00_02765 [Candidatus Moraniibacteriota bacterium]
MLHTKKQPFSETLRGFSIAEAMLAAFVLVIGLTAVVALIGNSLKHSFETRDTIIAVGLAQEGVELVRNIRDNDFAAGGSGFADFSSAKHCRIDYNDAANSPDCAGSPGSASQYALGYNNGFYEHSGSGRFSRYMYIDYDDTPDKENALVRSFVYWGGLFTLPSNGSAAQCTVATKCVFTEIKLTSWK